MSDGTVYVVYTIRPDGTMGDLEVLDARPRWAPLPGQAVRVANINGGDSAETFFGDPTSITVRVDYELELTAEDRRRVYRYNRETGDTTPHEDALGMADHESCAAFFENHGPDNGLAVLGDDYSIPRPSDPDCGTGNHITREDGPLAPDQCERCDNLVCPDTGATVDYSAAGDPMYWHRDHSTCFLHQHSGD